MAEFKVEEDYKNKARMLLSKMAKLGILKLEKNTLIVTFDEKVVSTLASELLDVYKEGWNDRCLIL